MYEKLKELAETSQSFVELTRGIYEEYQERLLQDPHCLPGLPLTLFTIFYHSVYVGHHALSELVNMLANVEEAEKNVIKLDPEKVPEKVEKNEESK